MKNFIKNNKIILLISTALSLMIYSLSFVPYYGYFIDEFYYIACANRIDLGYVDHPPFSIFLLAINDFIFGTSIYSIRILPALSFGALVFISYKIGTELSDKKSIGYLSLISIALFPVYMIFATFFSMNIFELVIINLLILFLIKLINTENYNFWYGIGVINGIGLMNKHTAIIYLIAIFAGILMSNNRKILFNIQFLFSIIITIAILLPNIFWQINNDFPSFEFYKNAAMLKNIPSTPIQIITGQIMIDNPVNFILSIIGLIYILTNKDLIKYRNFAYSFIFLLLVMFISGSSRPDRISAIYPVMISIAWVGILSIKSIKLMNFAKISTIVLLFVSTIILAPITLPVLKPDSIMNYMKYSGIKIEIEKGKLNSITQILADRLDW
jgi:4-amino-4-deoxy-L-arabinose transferase-like glycosyltransferase